MPQSYPYLPDNKDHIPAIPTKLLPAVQTVQAYKINYRPFGYCTNIKRTLRIKTIYLITFSSLKDICHVAANVLKLSATVASELWFLR
jgi:hypothetical protein